MKKKALDALRLAAVISFLFLIHIFVSYIDVTLDLLPSSEAKEISIKNAISAPFSNITGIHMVNDVKKLSRVLRKNKNFELDAFFVNGDFYIAHDKEDISDLTLPQLLSSHDISDSYIWLDLKNTDNGKVIAEHLAEILLEAGISKDRFIVEAAPSVIKDLSDAGFYTAFTPPINKKMSKEKRIEVLESTEKLILETGVSALEGNITQYAMLRDYFPQMDKIVHFARPYVSVRKNFFIRRLSKDPKVKFFVVEEF